MATWDGSLPAPLLAGYNSRETPRILKTEMDSGPQRMTLYSGHPRLYGSAAMSVDPAQAAAFRAMYESANLGADWITGCPIDTGQGLAAHRVRITSVQYSVQLPPDKKWKIVFTFETDERNAP